MLESATCGCPCGGQPLSQPCRLSSPLCLHVSPCPSKTAAWQITCVGGPPCSCPAVRPPLINAQAGARAVWQHKTNNATTQPSLLLTEMQPTALFRPLRLHSAPCSRPSKNPPISSVYTCTCLRCSTKLLWWFLLLLEAELSTETHTSWHSVTLNLCCLCYHSKCVLFVAAQSVRCFLTRFCANLLTGRSDLNVLFFSIVKIMVCVCVCVCVCVHMREKESRQERETQRLIIKELFSPVHLSVGISRPITVNV